MIDDEGAGEAPIDRAYALELGARLRAIRGQQGMSLQAVERKSNGKWKAVVVGSYERGDRSVSVTRLAELAEFYSVPITELLPGKRPRSTRADEFGRIVINLATLSTLSEDQVGPLRRFITMIQIERDDFGNRMMSLRADDLRALAIVYNTSVEALYEQLVDWDLLIQRL